MWAFVGNTRLVPESMLANLVARDDLGSDSYWRAVDSASGEDVQAVAELCKSPDARIRCGAVSTLALAVDSPSSKWLPVVLDATDDPAASVREVACFVLGEQWRDLDNPALRAALGACLSDDDPATRAEAMLGLAYRHDADVVEHVRVELNRPVGQVPVKAVIAAGVVGDPDLHPLVVRHVTSWKDSESRRTADAVRRLTDPAGPGEDLLDGMATLYRRRAHGQPDGPALLWWHRTLSLLEIAPARAGEFLDAIGQRLTDDPDALRELRQNSVLAVDAKLMASSTD
jgi:hypothetical protein